MGKGNSQGDCETHLIDGLPEPLGKEKERVAARKIF